MSARRKNATKQFIRNGPAPQISQNELSNAISIPERVKAMQQSLPNIHARISMQTNIAYQNYKQWCETGIRSLIHYCNRVKDNPQLLTANSGRIWQIIGVIIAIYIAMIILPPPSQKQSISQPIIEIENETENETSDESVSLIVNIQDYWKIGDVVWFQESLDEQPRPATIGRVSSESNSVSIKINDCWFGCTKTVTLDDFGESVHLTNTPLRHTTTTTTTDNDTTLIDDDNYGSGNISSVNVSSNDSINDSNDDAIDLSSLQSLQQSQYMIQSRVDDLDRQLSRVSVRIQQYSSQQSLIVSLEKQLSDVQSTILDISEYSSEVAQHNPVLEGLRYTIDELQTQLNGLDTISSQQWNDFQSDIQSRMTSFESDIQSLNEAMPVAVESPSSSNIDYSEAIQLLSTQIRQIDFTTDELSQKLAVNDDLQPLLDSVDTIRSEMNGYQSRIESIEKDSALNDFRSEIIVSIETVEHKLDTLEQSFANIQSIQSQKKTEDDDTNALESRITKIETNILSLVQSIDSQPSTLIPNNSNSDELESRIDALESITQQLSSQLTSQTTTLQQSLSQPKPDPKIEMAVNKIQSFEADLQQYLQSNESQFNRLNAVENRLDSLNIDQLYSQLQSLQQLIISADVDVDNGNSTKDARILHFTNALLGTESTASASSAALRVDWTSRVVYHSDLLAPKNFAAHVYQWLQYRLLSNYNQRLITPMGRSHDCLPFDPDSKAEIIIRLTQRIEISAITIQHIHNQLTAYPHSAPQYFFVWASVDRKKWSKLGKFRYEMHNTPVQSFDTQKWNGKYVKFEFISNWGASHTCIYRLKVHGTPL